MRPKHGGEIDQCAWPVEKNGWLDFSVNLNPFAVKLSDEDWLEAKDLMFRYPPPTSSEVDAALAQYLGLESPSLLVSTRGGMEAIRFALKSNAGRTVHIPVPCFSEYAFLCEQLGMICQLHTIDDGAWRDPNAWFNFPIEPRSVVLIGNPNNPFGHGICAANLQDKLSEFADKDIHLIIDEAFVDLTDDREMYSALSLISKFPNLTIVGSMTKSWAIPGIRLGYIVLSEAHTAKQLREQQETWSHGSLSHYWTQKMLQPAPIREHWRKLKALPSLRNSFFKAINASRCLHAYPSTVNYGVCEWKSGLTNLSALIAELNANQIHVRECDSIPGMNKGRFIRLAVRSQNDNQRFLNVLSLFESKQGLLGLKKV